MADNTEMKYGDISEVMEAAINLGRALAASEEHIAMKAAEADMDDEARALIADFERCGVEVRRAKTLPEGEERSSVLHDAVIAMNDAEGLVTENVKAYTYLTARQTFRELMSQVNAEISTVVNGGCAHCGGKCPHAGGR